MEAFKACSVYPLVIFFYALLENQQGHCYQTCNVRPDYSNFSTPTTGTALSGTLYFDLNNPFTCYGILKQWRFCYRRSPGIQSDTLKIGLYQLDGNSYTKKSSNFITLQLKDSECITVDSDPQLVVQQGYVVAFTATSTYIKFYDDTQNGYLYKTVLFPNSVSKGVLIKTSNPYAPKVQGYVETLGTSSASNMYSSTSSSKSSYSTLGDSQTMKSSLSTVPSSAVITQGSPLWPHTTPTVYYSASLASSTVSSAIPMTEGSIPPPDLGSDQCAFGIQEGNVSFYQRNSSTFINWFEPSKCEGNVIRWEFCHEHVTSLLNIQLSVWRLVTGSSLVLVGQNVVSVHPQNKQESLECTSVTGDIQGVRIGDVVGITSPEISIAFTTRIFDEEGLLQEENLPLLRAIIRK